MNNYQNLGFGDAPQQTGPQFQKGATWAAKHDPTLHNSIDKVLPDGSFEMTDGEVYDADALQSTHSYINVAAMGFAQDISEGVDFGTLAEIERKKETYGLDLVTSVHEVEANVAASEPDFSKMTLQQRAEYEANKKLGIIGWNDAKHVGPVDSIHTTQITQAQAYTVPDDPQFQAFVTMANGEIPDAESIKLFAKMFKISTEDMIDYVARMFEVPELNKALVEKAATDLINKAFAVKQDIPPHATGHQIID